MIWVFDYAKAHRIEKEVRCLFMPLAYLELSKLVGGLYALKLVKAGILILYQSGYLFYLIPLQNRYFELLEEVEQKEREQVVQKRYQREKKRIKEERDALLSLCEEVGVDWMCLEPIQKYKNAYLLAELLYRHRTYLGLSQEKFCMDVCSTSSYNKVEKGTIVPKRKFKELMRRIGYPPTNVLVPLHGSTKKYMDQAVKIKWLNQQYRYKESDIILKKLLKIFQQKKLIQNCPRNQQFFIEVQAILDYELKRISDKEEKRQLEYALMLTIPEYPKFNISKRPLFIQEAILLNNIANVYSRYGEYKNAIQIWEDVRCSYQRSHLYGKSIEEGYNMIQANYVSCVSSSGNYKKSTQLAYENIVNFLREADMRDLHRFCYNIAWNREQEVIERCGIAEKEKVCEEKLRQAEIFARMLQDKFMIEFIKNHN